MANTETRTVTSEFKVGDFHHNYCVPITVPDYGVSIPECHSTGPIGSPVYLEVYKVVNMIQRGIHVQFTRKDDDVKLYYFIHSWNKIANEINKQAGETLNAVATETENYLLEKVRYKITIEEKESGEDNSESENFNPFKHRLHPIKTTYANNYITNDTIQNKFRKKKVSDETRKHISEHKLFDIFNTNQDQMVMSQAGEILTGDVDTPSGRGLYDDIDFSNDVSWMKQDNKEAKR